MFPELNNLLNCRETFTIKEKFIVVDERENDGSFLLHHVISMYLRNHHNVCFIALAQAVNHYRSVANKLGVDFGLYQKNKSLLFLEIVKNLGQHITDNSCVADMSNTNLDGLIQFSCDHNSLKLLLTFIRDRLIQMPEWNSRPTIIIIDDITVLVHIGISLNEIIQFVKYLKNIIFQKTNSCNNLMLLVHNQLVSTDEEINNLIKYLHHQSSLILQVDGLKSGHCKDIHGEITARWKNDEDYKPTTAVVKTMHFKITDKTVSLFAKGTSSAVL